MNTLSFIKIGIEFLFNNQENSGQSKVQNFVAKFIWQKLWSFTNGAIH